MGLGWHPIYEMENQKCSSHHQPGFDSEKIAFIIIVPFFRQWPQSGKSGAKKFDCADYEMLMQT